MNRVNINVQYFYTIWKQAVFFTVIQEGYLYIFPYLDFQAIFRKYMLRYQKTGLSENY